MEGSDEDHVDIIDESCQPIANKRLKKDDNTLDDDRPNQSQENAVEVGDDKNPFEIPLVMDVMFKMLPFEELKKFRLVSATWNDVGTSAISKRPQKPIEINSREELEDDNKLGALIQLKRSHNQVFSGDQHQIFRNFSIDIDILTCSQIDKFFENFSPRYFELLGHCVMYEEVPNLCESLIKISPTVQEIKFNFQDYCQDQKMSEEVIQELTSTSFPNLLKFSSNVYYSLDCDYMSDLKVKKLLFYSLVGQNSPKLRHLELGNIAKSSLGSPEYMKEQFEESRLMSKLQILSLFDLDHVFNRDVINVFTEFGQNGTLKLTSLQIKQKRGLSAERFKDIFDPLIASQEETLKILEISTRKRKLYRRLDLDTPPFPSLQNLLILTIDYFLTFEIFEPINFGLQYPKLVEFRTRDINTFLINNLGQGGDSVKSVILLKDPYMQRNGLYHFIKEEWDFEKFYQIFPNLEFLELRHFNFYPAKSSVPFRPQLRRVVIHCEIDNLFEIDRELLQDAKKIELVVDCGSNVTDDSYKVYLGGFMKGKVEDDHISVPEFFNSDNTRHKYKYYQHFLDRISRNFTFPSVSLTFFGYNISEDLKLDLEAILPHCTFTCSPFKSADEY